MARSRGVLRCSKSSVIESVADGSSRDEPDASINRPQHAPVMRFRARTTMQRTCFQLSKHVTHGLGAHLRRRASANAAASLGLRFSASAPLPVSISMNSLAISQPLLGR